MAVKVSILDLTVDQVETLEAELGKPVDQWDELPSRAALFRRIYAMATGADEATVRAMTMREVTEAVSLGEEEVTETENHFAADRVAAMARVFGWTMNEVRAHTVGDVRAMARILVKEQEEQERQERRRKAHAASKAMSR